MISGAGRALTAIAVRLGDDSLLYGPLQSISKQIDANAGETLTIGENIKDPTKVVRCARENAVSVAKFSSLLKR